jgi:hypothetical protein
MKCAILFLVITSSFFAKAQNGCMDLQATNYNSSATINDGSCVYNTTIYNLLKLDSLENTFNEISGMAYWNGKLYVHNDGGNTAIMYEIDTSLGYITKVIELPITNNIDWEDITQDSLYFYIADVGNNAGNRTDLKIFKFPKASIGNGFNVSIPDTVVEEILFTYPDQTNFTSSFNATKFDCEAMVYKNGLLHLFTKNWVDSICVHYTIPSVAGSYVATRLDSLNGKGILITGADIFENQLILIGYQVVAPAHCALWYIYDFDNTSNQFFTTGNKRKIDIGSAITLGQLESICFENAQGGFASNERFNPVSVINIPANLYRFKTTDWFPYKAFTEVDNISKTAPFSMSYTNTAYEILVTIHSDIAEEGILLLHHTDGRIIFKKKVKLQLGINKIFLESEEGVRYSKRVTGVQLLTYSSISKTVTEKLNVVGLR